MKQLASLLFSAVAIGVLTALAVGVVISASHGRPSVLLIGAFVLNSVALWVIAGSLIGGRSKRPN